MSPGAGTVLLNWDSGDCVSVYVPKTGQLVDLRSEAALRNDVVHLEPLAGSGPPQYPERVYVILRTSSQRYSSATSRQPRRFRIDGIDVEEESRDQSARLVGDGLNYDTSGAPNQKPWLRDGDGENLYHPWVQGDNTDPTRMCPEPRRDQGWYLLGRFTGRPTAQLEGSSHAEPVWMLVYYNERLSRLRLYLLPKITTVTGLDVTIRLLGRDPHTPAGFVHLRGAFFDDDPRAQHWSQAHLVIPEVKRGIWVMAEANVLFPMAEGTSMMKDASYVAGDPALPPEDPELPERRDWYVPLYDCTFEANYRNVRLSIEITPFLQSTANLDFIGRGVGSAIQHIAGSGISPFTVLKDTVDSGIGAYKAASSIYDYVKAEYKKDNPNAAALPGLLSLGAGAFSGAAAAVGAAITLVTWLLKEDEPLRLAIELQLRGSVTGTIYTPLSTIQYDVYLPGRFDAREMHVAEGLPLGAADLDQHLPCYGRTLGHLGVRYNPARLRLPMIYFGPDGDVPGPGFNEGAITCVPEYWQWAMRCVWPAPRTPVFPYTEFDDPDDAAWTIGSPSYPAYIPGFLPIVLNEFAEIVAVDPAGSRPVPLAEQGETPYQRTRQYLGNTSFAAHLEPEPGDTGFPLAQQTTGPVGGWSIWVYRDGDWTAYAAPIERYIQCQGPTEIRKGEGYWVDAGPGRRIHSLRDFDHYAQVETNGFGQMSIIMCDLEHVGGWPNVSDVDFFPEDLHAKNFRPYRPDEAWPIADVVFVWDVAYLYYGRTRHQPGGSTPRQVVSRRLRSPVCVAVQRFDCDYGIREFSWEQRGGVAPSICLIDRPW